MDDKPAKETLRDGKADSFDIEIIGIKEVEPIQFKRPLSGNANPYGAPEQDDLKIYISAGTLGGIYRHLATDLHREQGGLLLGNYCRDQDAHFVDITDYIIAEHTEGSGVHLKFTFAMWAAADKEIERRYPNKEKIVVGWYHSHPGLGVFVSSHDQRVQKEFHSWWQTALVVDPRARTFGFFRTRGEWLLMCNGVTVYDDGVQQIDLPLTYAKVPPIRQSLSRQQEPDDPASPGTEPSRPSTSQLPDAAPPQNQSPLSSSKANAISAIGIPLATFLTGFLLGRLATYSEYLTLPPETCRQSLDRASIVHKKTSQDTKLYTNPVGKAQIVDERAYERIDSNPSTNPVPVPASETKQ